MPTFSSFPKLGTETVPEQVNGTEEFLGLDSGIIKRIDVDQVSDYVLSQVPSQSAQTSTGLQTQSITLWSGLTYAVKSITIGTTDFPQFIEGTVIGTTEETVYQVPQSFGFVPKHLFIYMNNVITDSNIINIQDANWSTFPMVEIIINDRSTGSLLLKQEINYSQSMVQQSFSGGKDIYMMKALQQSTGVNLLKNDLSNGTEQLILRNNSGTADNATPFSIDVMPTTINLPDTNFENYPFILNTFLLGNMDINIKNIPGEITVGSSADITLRQAEFKVGISGLQMNSPVEQTKL